MTNLKTKQNGFTALEMIAVLLVAALIIGGAAAGIATLLQKQKNSADLQNHVALLSNARMLKGPNGYGSSGTDLTASVIATDGVPGTMSVVSGVIYNVYGGAVSIDSTGIGMTMTTEDVPPAACVELARLVGRGDGIQTAVNGGTAVDGAFDAPTATTQCSSDDNDLTWDVAS